MANKRHLIKLALARQCELFTEDFSKYQLRAQFF